MWSCHDINNAKYSFMWVIMYVDQAPVFLWYRNPLPVPQQLGTLYPDVQPGVNLYPPL